MFGARRSTSSWRNPLEWRTMCGIHQPDTQCPLSTYGSYRHVVFPVPRLREKGTETKKHAWVGTEYRVYTKGGGGGERKNPAAARHRLLSSARIASFSSSNGASSFLSTRSNYTKVEPCTPRMLVHPQVLRSGGTHVPRAQRGRSDDS